MPLLDLRYGRTSSRLLRWGREGLAIYHSLGSGYRPLLSWSQDGEDLAFRELESCFGFFVDVGAHHPFRFSNTQRLVLAGWTGVNIDVSPDFLSLFNKARPLDTNVRALIGENRTLDFYHYSESALSTGQEERRRYLSARGQEPATVERLKADRLADVLAEVTVQRVIDLLLVDAEDMDLEILKTHDWESWPTVRVLVEIHGDSVSERLNGEISKFLMRRGFEAKLVLHRSVLFVQRALETTVN